MTLQWSPALAVGIDEIDAQHQELFRRAEQFILCLRAGDRSQVVALLAYLDEYATTHFGAEEREMRAAGYPGYEAHRAAHEAFKAELALRADDLAKGGPTPMLGLTLHNWLSDWLRSHVGGADRELGAFLRSRGVSGE